MCTASSLSAVMANSSDVSLDLGPTLCETWLSLTIDFSEALANSAIANEYNPCTVNVLGTLIQGVGS